MREGIIKRGPRAASRSRVYRVLVIGALILALSASVLSAAAVASAFLPMSQVRQTARQIARKDAFDENVASWSVSCLRYSYSTAHCKIFLTNEQGYTCYTLVRFWADSKNVYSRWMRGGSCDA